MRGNSHVRFGAGDEETCLGNEVRRFIPTLPANAAALSLSAKGLRLFHTSQSEKPRGSSAFATARRWVCWPRSNLDRDSAADRAQARSFYW
jgi:hypothetical protein